MLLFELSELLFRREPLFSSLLFDEHRRCYRALVDVPPVAPVDD